MLKRSLSLAAFIVLLLATTTLAGINWKAVWLDAPYNPVHLKVGDSCPYTVVGLNGMDTKADLTHSQYLTIVSSDPSVLEIDRKDARFVGKAPGKVEIRISFSQATSIVQAAVVPESSR